jgi:hypothetical protein
MKYHKYILTSLLAFTGLNAWSQETETQKNNGWIGLNSPLSYKMMEPNQNLRKVYLLAYEKQNDNLEENRLVIGTSLIAITDYQHSDLDSKFGYLMRHPTSNNQIGTDVSETVIHSFQLATMGSVTKWLTLYAEVLYNPEQSFGTGTITSLERNQLELRKGFVLFGNLNTFPMYGAIGKMDGPFGLTGSVNPFTNSTMWHAFGTLGYGAQVGFSKWNIHASFMAVQGGSQFRAMNTIVGDSSNVPSKLNNFITDINYTIQTGKESSVMVGYSYLRGSAYCQDFPVTHFSAAAINNPASTVYSQITITEHFSALGAYAITADAWPGTHNPFTPLDIYEASRVSTWSAGAKYIFNPAGKFVYTVSGEFSKFVAGPEGAPWERQSQLVGGFSMMLKQSSKLFLEVFQTQGYVPLNYISGSNPNDPFPEGITHCVYDTQTIGIVVGAQITL